MNTRFDELTKGLAQSVTRRAALKQFGVGLAGMALACFGLANKANAARLRGYCLASLNTITGPWVLNGACVDINGCVAGPSADCQSGKIARQGVQPHCAGFITGHKCSYTI
jgi:hypothetical protein